MSQPAPIVEVTQANFKAEVIDASAQTPVIVYFWAMGHPPSEGPARDLAQLAQDFRGAFRLALVDVTLAPDIAQAMRVASLPTLTAVFQGGFLDQLEAPPNGSLDRQAMRSFVEGALARAGVPLPGGEETPPAPSDPAAAEAHWRAKLAENKRDGEALLQLGKLLMTQGRAQEAKEVLERITARMDQYNDALRVMNLHELLEEIAALGGEPALRARLAASPEDREAAYGVALADGVAGAFESSLTSLVGLSAGRQDPVRDKARKAASVLFDAAGREDPAVEDLRRRLARLLF